VRSALATIDAVYQVGVEVDTESIFIGYDAAFGAPEEAAKPMLAALKRAGFDPWFKKAGWPAGTTAEVLPVRQR
jgi:hypothetical protein